MRFRRSSPLLVIVAAAVLSACGYRTPPATVTSPVRGVTVTTPKLMMPGARWNSEGYGPGAWRASFSDDLCRQFWYDVAPDTLPAGFDYAADARTRVVPRMTADGVTDVRFSEVTLEGIGPATMMLYRSPKAVSCNVTTYAAEGGRSRERPPADVARLFYRQRGLVHYAEYAYVTLDPGASMFGIRVAPVDSVLLDFVRGIAVPEAGAAGTR